MDKECINEAIGLLDNANFLQEVAPAVMLLLDGGVSPALVKAVIKECKGIVVSNAFDDIDSTIDAWSAMKIPYDTLRSTLEERFSSINNEVHAKVFNRLIQCDDDLKH